MTEHEGMEIRVKAWFPNAKRLIHFEELSFCDEYDTLCLNIRESDCIEEYQHLAGKSYIPNEDGIIIGIEVIKQS